MIMGIEKKHIKIGIVKMAPPDPMSPNVIPIAHKAPYPNNTKSILQSQPPTSYTIRKKTIGQKKTSKPNVYASALFTTLLLHITIQVLQIS